MSASPMQGGHNKHILYSAKSKKYLYANSRTRTSKLSSTGILQTLQSSATKLGVLRAERSRRLDWRPESLAPSTVHGYGHQQISGAVYWPQMKPAHSRLPDTLAPTSDNLG